MDRRCWSRVLKLSSGAGPVRALPLPSVAPSGPGISAALGPGSSGSAAAALERERLALNAERVRLQQVITLLQSSVEKLAAARQEVLRGAEEEILELSLQVARRVIHDEVTHRPELIGPQVQAALARVRESGAVTVRVHPSALPILQESAGALFESLESAAKLHFEPDASVEPGGCLVETPQRIVDARVESQLNKIGQALKQADTDTP